MVKELGKENDIDRSYYDKLATDAAVDISKFGDFEWFASDDSVEEPVEEPSTDDNLPWLVACGKETCVGCPNFTGEKCKLGHDISDMLYVSNQKQ